LPGIVDAYLFIFTQLFESRKQKHRAVSHTASKTEFDISILCKIIQRLCFGVNDMFIKIKGCI